jgi:hypothetical protein
MASKKTGRLAGLAALAGAAYLADKKGMFGGKEAPSDSSYDTLERKRMPAKAEDVTEEGESVQSKFRKEELKAGDVAAMAPSKVAPVKTTTAAPATQRSAGPTPSRAPGGAGKRGAITSGSGSAGPMSGAAWNSSKDDGGKSVVDRQDAAAKKAGLSVKDYYDSGKAKIDEQDAKSAAAKQAFLAPRPGIMARMREKDKEMFKNMKLPKESAETEREPAPDLASAYSGADTYKRGGAVKKRASGGMTSSASKRGDGIATKGKTRGKMC